MALDKLPNFLARPTPDHKPGPHHQCSIHLNCESIEVLETAYKEAINGRPSARYLQYSTGNCTCIWLNKKYSIHSIPATNSTEGKRAEPPETPDFALHLWYLVYVCYVEPGPAQHKVRQG